MNRSKIEYLRSPEGKEGSTWNPLTMRCSPAGPECAHCWHLAFARRHAANPTFTPAARAAYAGGAPFLDEEELLEPLRRRKPVRIAVQFMGDIFHETVTEAMLQRIFGAMWEARQHTYLVLTKRAEHMCSFFDRWLAGGIAMGGNTGKNIWMGVSAGTQKAAEALVPYLLRTPAAVRWISAEPLLENLGTVDLQGISWVVCGAETASHKRPCKPEWIDSLRDQCAEAGVPFFGKVDGDGEAIIPREYPL